MSKESIVEVDANKLSDEVIESLVEEGGLNKQEAEELGDKIWFEEIDVGDDNKTSALSYLKTKYENLVEVVGLIRDLFAEWKTTRAEVESVERTSSDNVQINFGHARLNGVESFTLDRDSDALANLMTYKKVSNPKNLEGCDLLALPESFDNRNITVLIPHNVSPTGRLRFRLYSVTREALQKTRASLISDMTGTFANNLFFTSLLSLIPMIFGILLILNNKIVSYVFMAPTAICISICLFAVVYGLVRSSLAIFMKLLSSQFEEP